MAERHRACWRWISALRPGVPQDAFVSIRRRGGLPTGPGGGYGNTRRRRCSGGMVVMGAAQISLDEFDVTADVATGQARPEQARPSTAPNAPR